MHLRQSLHHAKLATRSSYFAVLQKLRKKVSFKLQSRASWLSKLCAQGILNHLMYQTSFRRMSREILFQNQEEDNRIQSTLPEKVITNPFANILVAMKNSKARSPHHKRDHLLRLKCTQSLLSMNCSRLYVVCKGKLMDWWSKTHCELIL